MEAGARDRVKEVRLTRGGTNKVIHGREGVCGNGVRAKGRSRCVMGRGGGSCEGEDRGCTHWRWGGGEEVGAVVDEAMG